MNNIKPLNMKDIAIIDAFPVHNCQKKVLNVGCGDGRIDYHLASIGYKVYATDVCLGSIHKSDANLTFHQSDIFDLSSFPLPSFPIVICSQVLEHLRGYKLALVHLLALTGVRLIITVPYKRSFFSPEHINFWDEGSFVWKDQDQTLFKGIDEFIDLCQPYSTAISKIRTKPEDVMMRQWAYLIVVDKRQNI